MSFNTINDLFKTYQFYQTGSDTEANQPPVPLNIPLATPPTANSEYILTTSDRNAGEPFDFTIRRRSSNQIMQANLDTSFDIIKIF